jgi:hypothetical protein
MSQYETEGFLKECKNITQIRTLVNGSSNATSFLHITYNSNNSFMVLNSKVIDGVVK